MNDKELDAIMEIAWGLDDPQKEMLVRELKRSRLPKKLDKSVNTSMYVNLLEQFYYALIANSGEHVAIKLPHSSVHYVAAVIKDDKEFIEELGYTPSLDVPLKRLVSFFLRRLRYKNKSLQSM
jgi:ABC-type uncharacterized transport system substrate-binding protein